MTSTSPSPATTGHGVAVVFEEMHRWYGPVHALNGLSIDIAPGELIALLGPSGCGKTTALRALGGLDVVDAGRILVDGKEMTRVPANKRNMGIVFQAYSLFPNMTARDNVAYGLRLRGVDGAGRKKRAEETLDLVGLGQQAGRYPHQMSGGQQQRVALARALAIEPKVLLLDEPLSALDAKVRRQLREEIRRIQIMVGITTLFVTHDQEEALAMGDRVGVMSSGRLEQIAPPAELYDRPTTRFVAEFVGLTNRIAGDADGADGQRPRHARRAAAGVGGARPRDGPGASRERARDAGRGRHRARARGQLPRLALPRPGCAARRDDRGGPDGRLRLDGALPRREDQRGREAGPGVRRRRLASHRSAPAAQAGPARVPIRGPSAMSAAHRFASPGRSPRPPARSTSSTRPTSWSWAAARAASARPWERHGQVLRTTLLERFGCFGGNITAVGVESFAWYRHEQTVDSVGVGVEIEARARAMGATSDESQSISQAFDAERFKVVADALVEENGHPPDAPPHVRRADRRGRRAARRHHREQVRARGHPGRAGSWTRPATPTSRRGPARSVHKTPREQMLSASVMFSMTGVNKRRFIDAHRRPTRQKYSDWAGNFEWDTETDGKEDELFSPFLRKPFKQGRGGGRHPARPDHDGRHLGTVTDTGDLTYLNLVHLGELDGTDADDLTRGEIEGRRQAMHAIEALRHFMPGCEDARLRNFGMTLGIRDTRKIDALYNLTAEDVRGQARFEDSDRDLPGVHRRVRRPRPADHGALLPRAVPARSCPRAWATCWSRAGASAATRSATRPSAR